MNSCIGGIIRGRIDTITLAALAAAFLIIAFALGGARVVFAADSPTAPTAQRPCKTVTPKVFNRYVRRLDRLERLNPADLKNLKHRRATRKVCKRPHFERLKRKLRRICAPHHVVTGRTSNFNDSTTASRISASRHEGIAINTDPGQGTSGWDNPRIRSWMARGAKFKLTLKGVSRITRIIDLGPHQRTGRAVDLSYPLAAAMGFLTGWSFPTDSIGYVYRYLYGCR